MKKISCLIVGFILIMCIGYAQAAITTTTVDIDDIPEAAVFYVPIGDRSASIANDLLIDVNYSGGPVIVFPGDQEQDDWYVFTNFNTNRTYDGQCYDGSEPNCGDYHPGEDWNGQGGLDTDLGQPVYSIGAGVVIAKGDDSAFGNMVLIVHKLTDGELILSVYAHMQYATTLDLNDEVTIQTQIGNVGNSGSGAVYAHLHLEIRQQNMLSIDGGSISIPAAYPSNYWPGTNASFIASHYYGPTDFLKTKYYLGYFETLGFLTNGTSQAFVDEYDNIEFNGGNGIDIFGWPYNNGKSPYVHEWPDATCSTTPPAVCNTDGLYVQDFLLDGTTWSQLVLNTDKDKVIPVQGEILSFWNAHYGYSDYGAPITRQFLSAAEGNPSVEQLFEIDGTKTAIGYDLTAEQAYTFDIATPSQDSVSPNQDNASWFGWTADISGDLVLVGDPRTYDAVNQRGRAFLFYKGESGWEAADPIIFDDDFYDYGGYENFGQDVAIDNGDAIITAWQRDGDEIGVGHSTYANVGAVYFYSCSSGGYSLASDEFLGQGNVNDEYLGYSADISGDWAIAGATGYYDSGYNDTGAMYFFKRASGTWSTHTSHKVASNKENQAYLGYSVAIDGDYAIAGAYKHGSTDAGAVYFYEYDSGTDTWEEADVFVGDGADCIYLGQSVAISGDYALAGSSPKAGKVGRAFLFKRDNEGAWNKIAEIKAENGYAGDYFGYRVALDGHRAAFTGYTQERFWSFIISGDTYSQTAYVYEPMLYGYYYGRDSLAIDGFTAIAGEVWADGEYYTDSGVVHIYDLYIEPYYFGQ